MFDPKLWRAQGKKWNELPQSVKKIGDDELAIPAQYKSMLLPLPELSINAMLEFVLPSSAPGLHSHNTQLYFRREFPGPLTGITMSSLRRLPIPTASVIKNLINNTQQAWLDGYNSVQYFHLPGKPTTLFPLWAIHFGLSSSISG